MSKLAVFSFDGTIYRGDSMRDFARFLNSGRYYLSILKLLIPNLQLLFGATTKNELKAQFMAYNFAGYSKDDLEEKGRLFFEKNNSKCYSSAVNWMEHERKKGTQILILSASCRPWLQPFADYFAADLICTELAYKDDTSTGQWVDQDLNGLVKKEVLASYLEKQTDITYAMAFGNQDSDAIAGRLVDEYRQNYFH